jgi:hypothetical protein
MDPERQREIASEGGKAAHEKGTAHEFTSEEARRAGSMSHANRQSDQARSQSGSGSGRESASKQGASKQSGNKQSASKQSAPSHTRKTGSSGSDDDSR